MRKWLVIAVVLATFSCSVDHSETPVKTEDQPVVSAPAIQETSAPQKEATKPAQRTESHTAKADNAVEAELLSMVMQLDEIRKQDKKLRKQTNDKKSLRAIVSGRPSDDTEYYAIAVAENDDQAATTIYTFHVYPDQTILYYDPVTDMEMTLKAWEKTVR